MASYSSGNAFVSGAGVLRSKSPIDHIGHSAANGSTPLRHFFAEPALLGRYDAEMGLANSLHTLA